MKKKSITTARGQLVKGKSCQLSGARPSARKAKEMFHRHMVSADTDVGEQIVQNQARARANSQYGAEIRSHQLDQAELDARYELSAARLAELEREERTTPQQIKRSKSAEDKDKSHVPFREWRWGDRFVMCVLCIGLVTMMAAGAANVFTNLYASSAIFIEQPWLAWLISLVLPCGALALKFVSHGFDSYRNRKRYALSVYLLTALSLLAWSVVFALNFAGVSGGIDWDSLGESDGKGSLLVWLQITSELLIAASLAIAAQELALTYSPNAYEKNPEYINVAAALKQHQATHADLRDHRKRVHARLVELEALHTQSVNADLAAFHALREGYIRAQNY